MRISRLILTIMLAYNFNSSAMLTSLATPGARLFCASLVRSSHKNFLAAAPASLLYQAPDKDFRACFSSSARLLDWHQKKSRSEIELLHYTNKKNIEQTTERARDRGVLTAFCLGVTGASATIIPAAHHCGKFIGNIHPESLKAAGTCIDGFGHLIGSLGVVVGTFASAGTLCFFTSSMLYLALLKAEKRALEMQIKRADDERTTKSSRVDSAGN